MKKTYASLAAVACVTLVAALAAPHAGAPTYQYGLSGNAWWASQGHRQPTTRVATPVFQYGLTGNEWWAAQGRRGGSRAEVTHAPLEN